MCEPQFESIMVFLFAMFIGQLFLISAIMASRLLSLVKDIREEVHQTLSGESLSKAEDAE